MVWRLHGGPVDLHPPCLAIDAHGQTWPAYRRKGMEVPDVLWLKPVRKPLVLLHQRCEPPTEPQAESAPNLLGTGVCARWSWGSHRSVLVIDVHRLPCRASG